MLAITLSDFLVLGLLLLAWRGFWRIGTYALPFFLASIAVLQTGLLGT